MPSPPPYQLIFPCWKRLASCIVSQNELSGSRGRAPAQWPCLFENWALGKAADGRAHLQRFDLAAESLLLLAVWKLEAQAVGLPVPGTSTLSV